MTRLVLAVAATVLSASTAFAATRPAHPSTVRVRRPRVAAAMAVHVHPFGHTGVHPILPHRTPPRSAKASGRPAVPQTTVRLKPSGYTGLRTATSRSSKR